ncbi:hypothetical protein F5Y11DRAFT_366925 [Daldinia sp. FL1419]|nr:hypothetical protein F5Y11DRAFT_366925 [Daldinia sp. FL1419]
MGQNLGLQRDLIFWGRSMQSTTAYFFDEEFRRRPNVTVLQYYEPNLNLQDYITDIVDQPSTLYHSTRICLNLPFIVNPESAALRRSTGPVSTSLSESIKICKSSAEEIADILERLKGQDTLGNAPLTLVQGAIVATSAIIVISRISSSLTSLVEDTPFPTLDEALCEMSASCTLASEARTRFGRSLGQQHPDQYEPNEVNEIAQEQGSAKPLDTFHWPHISSQDVIHEPPLDPALDLVSPEQ